MNEPNSLLWTCWAVYSISLSLVCSQGSTFVDFSAIFGSFIYRYDNTWASTEIICSLLCLFWGQICRRRHWDWIWRLCTISIKYYVLFRTINTIKMTRCRSLVTLIVQKAEFLSGLWRVLSVFLYCVFLDLVWIQGRGISKILLYDGEWLFLLLGWTNFFCFLYVRNWNYLIISKGLL